MKYLIPLLLAACQAPRAPEPPAPAPFERSAVVTTSCPGVISRGSAVVTGPHEITTAAHVVARHAAFFCPEPEVTFRFDGRDLTPLRLGADPDRDISHAVFAEDLGLPPAPIGRHVQGPACGYFDHPEHSVLCGWTGPDADGKEGTDIELGFSPVSGNSGGGLWQDDVLVGVVTARNRFGEGGWATSIVPRSP